MKTIRVCTVALGIFGFCYGQQQQAPRLFVMPPPGGRGRDTGGPTCYNVPIISNLLRSSSPLKVGTPQLHRMGDSAALALVKLLGAQDPTPTQAQLAVEMVRKAFEVPEAIVNPADREPTATLFLLRYLQLVVADQGSKTAAARASDYVLAQQARSR